MRERLGALSRIHHLDRTYERTNVNSPVVRYCGTMTLALIDEGENVETTYTSTQFQWGHEVTPVVRIQPPELTPAYDDEGDPVFDEQGEQFMTPPENWEPTPEEVHLDTIVILDLPSQQNGNTIAYKFPVEKSSLAAFIAFYVKKLDEEGRRVVREALTETSGIIVPELDTKNLRLIRGGKD